HGDGRFAIWCAAPDGLQSMLVEADPERFFVPPYVGHRGWLGVRLDRGLDWDELTGIVGDAFASVAPRALVERAVSGAQPEAARSASRWATSIFWAVEASWDHCGQEKRVDPWSSQPTVQASFTPCAVVLNRPAFPRMARTALAPRLRRTTSRTSQSSIP